MKIQGLALLAVLFVAFVSVGMSHAQSNYNFTSSTNSTIVLTTGINSIDAFSAYPLANQHGIPVVSINGTNISQSFVANLTAEGVKTAIVLGGPAVISNYTISLLKAAGINVVRIWGVTAPETSLDAVEYMMPKPVFHCAVLAYYNETPKYDYPYQFAASILSLRNKCMVFPTYFSNVPSYILSYLQTYGIKNITFIGPHTLPASVFSNLSGASLRNVVGNQSYMENYTVSARHEKANRMLLVGVDSAAWNASLVLGSLPSLNSSIALVSNASAQMPGIINEIKTNNITEVRVVGIPTVVGQIDSYLSAAGINFTSYGGVGEGLMRKAFAHFKSDIHVEKEHYRGEFNVSVNASIIRQVIENAVHKLQYYNSTFYNMYVQNGTNVSTVYTSLKQGYSLLVTANNSLNAGNVTAAMQYILQAKSLINEQIYGSDLRNLFVGDSVNSSIHSVSENLRELIGNINEQLNRLNMTLTKWGNNSSFSNVTSSVRQMVGDIQKLVVQIHICAQQNNLSCLQSIGKRIKADVQRAMSSATRDGLENVPPWQYNNSEVEQRSSASGNVAVGGLGPFKVTAASCNSSGFYMTMKNPTDSNMSFTNVIASPIIPVAISSVSSGLVNAVNMSNYTQLKSPTLPFSLSSGASVNLVFPITCATLQSGARLGTGLDELLRMDYSSTAPIVYSARAYGVAIEKSTSSVSGTIPSTAKR